MDDPDLSRPIQLVGDETVTLEADDLASLPLEYREIEVVCHSGDRHTEGWQGVPVLELLELSPMPAETTHLLVESGDGHRACIAVETALEGLLAIGRNGEPLAADREYESRFVAPGMEGPRTVKDVRVLEGVRLEAGEDPESYEESTDIE